MAAEEPRSSIVLETPPVQEDVAAAGAGSEEQAVEETTEYNPSNFWDVSADTIETELLENFDTIFKYYVADPKSCFYEQCIMNWAKNEKYHEKCFTCFSTVSEVLIHKLKDEPTFENLDQYTPKETTSTWLKKEMKEQASSNYKYLNQCKPFVHSSRKDGLAIFLTANPKDSTRIGNLLRALPIDYFVELLQACDRNIILASLSSEADNDKAITYVQMEGFRLPSDHTEGAPVDTLEEAQRLCDADRTLKAIHFDGSQYFLKTTYSKTDAFDNSETASHSVWFKYDYSGECLGLAMLKLIKDSFSKRAFTWYKTESWLPTVEDFQQMSESGALSQSVTNKLEDVQTLLESLLGEEHLAKFHSLCSSDHWEEVIPMLDSVSMLEQLDLNLLFKTPMVDHYTVYYEPKDKVHSVRIEYTDGSFTTCGSTFDPASVSKDRVGTFTPLPGDWVTQLHVRHENDSWKGLRFRTKNGIDSQWFGHSDQHVLKQLTCGDSQYVHSITISGIPIDLVTKTERVSVMQDVVMEHLSSAPTSLVQKFATATCGIHDQLAMRIWDELINRALQDGDLLAWALAMVDNTDFWEPVWKWCGHTAKDVSVVKMLLERERPEVNREKWLDLIDYHRETVLTSLKTKYKAFLYGCSEFEGSQAKELEGQMENCSPALSMELWEDTGDINGKRMLEICALLTFNSLTQYVEIPKKQVLNGLDRTGGFQSLVQFVLKDKEINYTYADVKQVLLDDGQIDERAERLTQDFYKFQNKPETESLSFQNVYQCLNIEAGTEEEKVQALDALGLETGSNFFQKVSDLLETEFVVINGSAVQKLESNGVCVNSDLLFTELPQDAKSGLLLLVGEGVHADEELQFSCIVDDVVQWECTVKHGEQAKGVVRLNQAKTIELLCEGANKEYYAHWLSIRVIPINSEDISDRKSVRLLTEDGKVLTSQEVGRWEDISSYFITPLTTMDGDWYCEIRPIVDTDKIEKPSTTIAIDTTTTAPNDRHGSWNQTDSNYRGLTTHSGTDGWAEYQITSPYNDIKYATFKFQYNATDTRPIQILINEQLVAANLGAKTTGTWDDLEKLTWSEKARMELKPGNNKVRIQTKPGGSLPHIKQFEVDIFKTAPRLAHLKVSDSYKDDINGMYYASGRKNDRLEFKQTTGGMVLFHDEKKWQFAEQEDRKKVKWESMSTGKLPPSSGWHETANVEYGVCGSSHNIEQARNLPGATDAGWNHNNTFPQTPQWVVLKFDGKVRIKGCTLKNGYSDRDCVKSLKLHRCNQNFDTNHSWTEDEMRGMSCWDETAEERFMSLQVTSEQEFTFDRYEEWPPTQFFKFMVLDSYGGYSYIHLLKFHVEFVDVNIVPPFITLFDSKYDKIEDEGISDDKVAWKVWGSSHGETQSQNLPNAAVNAGWNADRSFPQWFVFGFDSVMRMRKMWLRNGYQDNDCIKEFRIEYLNDKSVLDGTSPADVNWHAVDSNVWTSGWEHESQKTTTTQEWEIPKTLNASQVYRFWVNNSYGGYSYIHDIQIKATELKTAKHGANNNYFKGCDMAIIRPGANLGEFLLFNGQEPLMDSPITILDNGHSIDSVAAVSDYFLAKCEESRQMLVDCLLEFAFPEELRNGYGWILNRNDECNALDREQIFGMLERVPTHDETQLRAEFHFGEGLCRGGVLGDKYCLDWFSNPEGLSTMNIEFTPEGGNISMSENYHPVRLCDLKITLQGKEKIPRYASGALFFSVTECFETLRVEVREPTVAMIITDNNVIDKDGWSWIDSYADHNVLCRVLSSPNQMTFPPETRIFGFVSISVEKVLNGIVDTGIKCVPGWNKIFVMPPEAELKEYSNIPQSFLEKLAEHRVAHDNNIFWDKLIFSDDVSWLNDDIHLCEFLKSLYSKDKQDSITGTDFLYEVAYARITNNKTEDLEHILCALCDKINAEVSQGLIPVAGEDTHDWFKMDVAKQSAKVLGRDNAIYQCDNEILQLVKNISRRYICQSYHAEFGNSIMVQEKLSKMAAEVNLLDLLHMFDNENWITKSVEHAVTKYNDSCSMFEFYLDDVLAQIGTLRRWFRGTVRGVTEKGQIRVWLKNDTEEKLFNPAQLRLCQSMYDLVEDKEPCEICIVKAYPEDPMMKFCTIGWEDGIIHEVDESICMVEKLGKRRVVRYKYTKLPFDLHEEDGRFYVQNMSDYPMFSSDIGVVPHDDINKKPIISVNGTNVLGLDSDDILKLFVENEEVVKNEEDVENEETPPPNKIVYKETQEATEEHSLDVPRNEEQFNSYGIDTYGNGEEILLFGGKAHSEIEASRWEEILLNDEEVAFTIRKTYAESEPVEVQRNLVRILSVPAPHYKKKPMKRFVGKGLGVIGNDMTCTWCGRKWLPSIANYYYAALSEDQTSCACLVCDACYNDNTKYLPVSFGENSDVHKTKNPTAIWETCLEGESTDSRLTAQCVEANNTESNMVGSNAVDGSDTTRWASGNYGSSESNWNHILVELSSASNEVSMAVDFEAAENADQNLSYSPLHIDAGMDKDKLAPASDEFRFGKTVWGGHNKHSFLLKQDKHFKFVRIKWKGHLSIWTMKFTNLEVNEDEVAIVSVKVPLLDKLNDMFDSVEEFRPKPNMESLFQDLSLDSSNLSEHAEELLTKLDSRCVELKQKETLATYRWCVKEQDVEQLTKMSNVDVLDPQLKLEGVLKSLEDKSENDLLLYLQTKILASIVNKYSEVTEVNVTRDSCEETEKEKLYVVTLLKLAQIIENGPSNKDLIGVQVLKTTESVEFESGNAYMDFMAVALSDQSVVGKLLLLPVEYTNCLLDTVFPTAPKPEAKNMICPTVPKLARMRTFTKVAEIDVENDPKAATAAQNQTAMFKSAAESLDLPTLYELVRKDNLGFGLKGKKTEENILWVLVSAWYSTGDAHRPPVSMFDSVATLIIDKLTEFQYWDELKYVKDQSNYYKSLTDHVRSKLDSFEIVMHLSSSENSKNMVNRITNYEEFNTIDKIRGFYLDCLASDAENVRKLLELPAEDRAHHIVLFEQEEINYDVICPICISLPALVTLVCDHKVCENCFPQLNKCPFCRSALVRK